MCPYRICDPHRLPKVVGQRTKKVGKENAGCLIYSIGSGGKWHFEGGMYDMLNGLCEIHVFDPGDWSKGHDDLKERNVHFHKWGLGSSYDKSFTPVVSLCGLAKLFRRPKILDDFNGFSNSCTLLQCRLTMESSCLCKKQSKNLGTKIAP